MKAFVNVQEINSNINVSKNISFNHNCYIFKICNLKVIEMLLSQW